VCGIYRGTELTLLSESIQLGTEIDEKWCNPRNITDLVTQISSIEDLDEDRTDLLGMCNTVFNPYCKSASSFF